MNRLTKQNVQALEAWLTEQEAVRVRFLKDGGTPEEWGFLEVEEAPIPEGFQVIPDDIGDEFLPHSPTPGGVGFAHEICLIGSDEPVAYIHEIYYATGEAEFSLEILAPGPGSIPGPGALNL